MPDNGCYQMFCYFHCHPQRSFMLHSTAWTRCIWSKVLSNPAKWYEGNSSKWICHWVFWKEMPLLQRESVESKSKAATTYLLYNEMLWRFHEKYYDQFRWSDIGIWILKYRCPSIGSQLSPQTSIEIYISSLKVKIPGHCHSWWYLHQHISIHLNTCHWWNSTKIHYYFPSMEVSELLHIQRYR